MPQITVSIAGRTYRMACAEGEEAHLESLAAGFDAKIDELRRAFGEIGDMRLHVMAALTLADELAETKKRVDALQEELAALRKEASDREERLHGLQAEFTETLSRAADRIERAARALNPPAAGR